MMGCVPLQLPLSPVRVCPTTAFPEIVGGEVFEGGNGGRRSAILLNAAGAIAAGGRAHDLHEGIGIAREALDSGAAASRLEQLVAFSQEGVVA